MARSDDVGGSGNSGPPAFWLTSGTAFGPAANVVPFQGDFNGDGLTDLAYYNLSTATWYMDESKQGVVTSFPLGNAANTNVPVVGYFDPNLPEEAAIYTIVNGQGTWSINTANAGVRTVAFGSAGDIPVPGDYTGVGYDEVAVYRPSTGQFFVLIPTPGGAKTEIVSLPAGTPDLSSLVPVPGNYDPYDSTATTFTGTLTAGSPSVTNLTSMAGLVVGQAVTGAGIPAGTTIQIINGSNGTVTLSANVTASGPESLTASGYVENTEPAWFDPKTGAYTIQGPNGAYTVSNGFQQGDIPVPADYAGKGSTQPVVFRPSTGQFIASSGTGGTVIATFAQASGNVPLAAPLSYRTPADPPATTSTSTGTTGTSTGTTSTSTGSSGSSGSGSTSTSVGTTGSSTGSGSGTTSGVTTGTGTSTSTGTSSSSGGTSGTQPAQLPTSSGTTTKSHKVVHKKAVPHPKPVVHAKKPVKPTTKKAAAHPKPKPQVHVVKHAAPKVTKVSTSSTSAEKRAHVVDLALQDIHVNLLKSSSTEGV